MRSRQTAANDSRLVGQASKLLQDEVLTCEALHGGDLSEVLRLGLGPGREVVVKSGPHPDREGRMLRAMADAGARVPRPIASNAEALVLEDLGPATSPSELSWGDLGTNLRTLHSARCDHYGWSEDYAFGKVRIHNGWSDNWCGFWFERRLVDAVDALPQDLAERLTRLGPRIAEILPARPAPALLHGDLWSGNVHFAGREKAFLIDPASYFGHSEVDLAMLTLFGAPPPAFWEAYGGLEVGWELRRCAYQLWPALVHLRLFGSGYRSLVDRLLTALE